MTLDETLIRDDDLKEQLAQGKSAGAGEVYVGLLIEEQRQRDMRGEMSPVQRRRADVRKEREENVISRKDQHHIHSVLALCGLPYRRPPDDQRDYIREYGRNSLAVTSGHLKNPETGKMEPQGLPYGPKARLLMLHICTMAVRQKSPEIEIAGSMSAFIRELGFAVTGGKRGSLTQFKEQLNRLAAAHMSIGMWKGEVTRTIKANPIECFRYLVAARSGSESPLEFDAAVRRRLLQQPAPARPACRYQNNPRFQPIGKANRYRHVARLSPANNQKDLPHFLESPKRTIRHWCPRPLEI